MTKGKLEGRATGAVGTKRDTTATARNARRSALAQYYVCASLYTVYIIR